MCLLVVFFRVVPDAPIVAGANREEAYARGGEPPQILDGPCRAAAGIDPHARGTWFGVNQCGVFVAVANRPKSQISSSPRSRGLLIRDMLSSQSAKAATELATKELGSNLYAGCNILCADQEDATVLHAGDWLRVRPLPPGLHALTAHDVNDLTDRRIAHTLWWLNQRFYDNADQCLAALEKLCRQTGNGGPPICLRGELGGTVSSSLVAVRTPLSGGAYLHCQGPPDRGPYENYSHLLGELRRTETAVI